VREGDDVAVARIPYFERAARPIEKLARRRRTLLLVHSNYPGWNEPWLCPGQQLSPQRLTDGFRLRDVFIGRRARSWGKGARGITIGC
jgi:hypothetical protein